MSFEQLVNQLAVHLDRRANEDDDEALKYKNQLKIKYEQLADSFEEIETQLKDFCKSPLGHCRIEDAALQAENQKIKSKNKKLIEEN